MDWDKKIYPKDISNWLRNIFESIKEKLLLQSEHYTSTLDELKNIIRDLDNDEDDSFIWNKKKTYIKTHKPSGSSKRKITINGKKREMTERERALFEKSMAKFEKQMKKLDREFDDFF